MLLASVLALLVQGLVVCDLDEYEYGGGYDDNSFSYYVEDIEPTFTPEVTNGRVRRFGLRPARSPSRKDIEDAEGAVNELISGRYKDTKRSVHITDLKRPLMHRFHDDPAKLGLIDPDLSNRIDDNILELATYATDPELIFTPLETTYSINSSQLAADNIVHKVAWKPRILPKTETLLARGPIRTMVHVPQRSTTHAPSLSTTHIPKRSTFHSKSMTTARAVAIWKSHAQKRLKTIYITKSRRLEHLQKKSTKHALITKLHTSAKKTHATAKPKIHATRTPTKEVAVQPKTHATQRSTTQLAKRSTTAALKSSVTQAKSPTHIFAADVLEDEFATLITVNYKNTMNGQKGLFTDSSTELGVDYTAMGRRVNDRYVYLDPTIAYADMLYPRAGDKVVPFTGTGWTGLSEADLTTPFIKPKKSLTTTTTASTPVCLTESTKVKTTTKKTIPPMPLYWRTYKPPTPKTTTPGPKFDIDKFLDIIANLTYDYYTNLTMEVNETLQKYIPTCARPGGPVTTELATTPEPEYIPLEGLNRSIISKCFVCGLDAHGIPRDADCADAFAGDFLPLSPIEPLAKGKMARFRKYCRYAEVRNYAINSSQPRTIYGRWTGGCAVRWADVTGIYTQRTCRNRKRAITGHHYASKRMARLEMALAHTREGCIVSPVATLTPLSRGISLFARYHACVCISNWCNAAARLIGATLPLAAAAVVVCAVLNWRNKEYTNATVELETIWVRIMLSSPYSNFMRILKKVLSVKTKVLEGKEDDPDGDSLNDCVFN